MYKQIQTENKPQIKIGFWKENDQLIQSVESVRHMRGRWTKPVL